MSELSLDWRDGTKDSYYVIITAKNESYQSCDSYGKVEYEINYKYTFSSWYFTRSYFYVSIKTNEQEKVIYTYYTYEDKHVLNGIEFYYSKKHESIPLILGFKRKDVKQYYRYVDLIGATSGYGLPKNGHFDENDIQEKLKEENERRNKIKFSTKSKKSTNYKIDIRSLSDFVEYKYSVSEETFKGLYELSTDKLFELEIIKDTFDYSLFDTLNEKSFDFIYVYYLNNTALLLVFESDSNKKCFKRRDMNGYFWVEQISSNDSNLQESLKQIKTDSENRITFKIEMKQNNSSNYKNDIIYVYLSTHDDFDKYTHVVETEYKNKKTNVSFNNLLMTVQQNSEILSNSLDNIQDKVYNTITVFYMRQNTLTDSTQKKNLDKDANINIPILIELNISTTKYVLQRLDKKGIKWKQINGTVDDLKNVNKRNSIVEQLNHSIRSSLVVIINNNLQDYPLKIIPNSSNLFSETFDLSSENIKLKQHSSLNNSSYTYYEHDLSKLTTSSMDNGTNIMSEVNGLKLFIKGESGLDTSSYYNPFEIILYDSDVKNRKYLDFKLGSPSNQNSTVYVYFYGRDNIPLLLYFDNWYRPTDKANYFSKWVNDKKLNNAKPTQSNNYTQIISQLEKINRELNEINLSFTNNVEYGLTGPVGFIQFPQSLNIARVKVERTITTFKKVTHTSKNKGPIGKVMFNGKDLQDEHNKNISQGTQSSQNQVNVYYHKTNNFNFPLLIGISGTSISAAYFFERLDKAEPTKWRKISQTANLLKPLGLEDKINSIHYNFTKSIVIQLEKNTKDSYNLCIIENSSLTQTSHLGSLTINVSEDSSFLTESGYKCFKHTIKSETSIKPEEIGGIKLFILKREIPTYKKDDRSETSPIFYDDSSNDFQVYFYNNSRVPLLFCYKSRYYGPCIGDNYFEKWIEIDIGTSGLETQLKEINKQLNEIDLSYMGVPKNYGIAKPQDHQRNLNNLGASFYDRITIQRCVNDYYRKVTHSTIVNIGIGTIRLNAQPTGIIGQFKDNVVCVYYQTFDIFYTKPLLIKICSTISPDVCQWYFRNSINGTNWTKEEEVNKGNYDSDEKLKQQLDTLDSKLFIPLTIKIESLVPYENTILVSNNEAKSGKIPIDLLGHCDGTKVDKYRCCEHQLYHYYNSIEHRTDLTFELIFTLFNKKIKLANSSGSVLPISTYGGTQAGFNTVIYAYFYESKGYGSTDNVPLLLKFNGKFYKPESKETYFNMWKEVDVFSGLQTSVVVDRHTDDRQAERRLQEINSSKKEKLESQLDFINSRFNEIDISKRGNYGIPYCDRESKKKSFYVAGESNTKRVKITNYKNESYIMRVHDTVNGFKIGDIKPLLNCKFNQHSLHLKSEVIHQVAVIFKIRDLKFPKLILLNQKNHYGHDHVTYGYYYESNMPPKTLEYKFKHIISGCYFLNKLKGESQDYDCSSIDDLSEVKILFDPITTKPMQRQSAEHSDTDIGDCKEEETGLTVEKCPEMVVTKPQVTSSLEPQVLQEDKRHSSLGDPDSSRAQKQHQPPQQQPPPVASSLPAPQLHPPDVSTLESSGKGQVVSQSSDLQQEPQTPGLEQASGSPQEVLPASHSVTRLDSSENTVASRGSGTIFHHEQEVERTLSGTDSAEQTPGRHSSPSEVLTTPRVDQAELGPPSEEGTQVQIDSVSLGTKHPMTQMGLSSATKSEDERSPDGLDSETGLESLSSSEHNQDGIRTGRTTNEVAVSDPDVSNSLGGTGGGLETETDAKGVGDKIMEFIGDHKEAVYGGGGTVATVAGGAYPAYRLIANFVSK